MAYGAPVTACEGSVDRNHIYCTGPGDVFKSLPARAVWIEMLMVGSYVDAHFESLPARAVWIEISGQILKALIAEVTACEGSVDRNSLRMDTPSVT